MYRVVPLPHVGLNVLIPPFFSQLTLESCLPLHQVVDTGLDETSCFFAHDETGDQIAHGYYYDELGTNFIGTSFSGDDG